MYKYPNERYRVFTDEGDEMIPEIEKEARRLFEIAGCATIEKLIAPCLGNSFTMLAVVDFLEERHFIRCIYQEGISRQRQIYTWGVSY